MFKIFSRKQKNSAPLKVVKNKNTLYDNLIYSGYKYSLTKAIDISLAIQKVTYDEFCKETIEVIRVKGNVSFQSKYSDVYNVEGVKDGIAEISVSNNYFVGVEGTLPDPYIEEHVLYNRTSKQPILEFFDIFNYKFITIRYIFDKQQVAECLSVRASDSIIGKIISSISGFGFGNENIQTVLPKQFRITAQNLFWKYTRSSEMLKVMLSSFFNVDVDIEQFCGAFTNEVSLDETTKIGTRSSNFNSLGQSTLLGRKIWDSAHGIVVNIRDLDIEEYKSFLPSASFADSKYSRLEKIKEIIREYVPVGTKVKIIFHLNAKNVKDLYLNGSAGLNKDLFLGGKSTASATFVEFV